MQAERAQRRDRLGRVGLTVSATVDHGARTAPSQRRRSRCAVASAASSRRRARSARHAQSRAAPGDRRRGDALDHALRRRGRAWLREPATGGQRRSLARRRRDRPRRSGARRRPRRAPARRRRLGVSPATSRRPHPARSSPCRSCPARWCRSPRVDSRTSGPLINSPSCAPRPVPTSSAVGVASPSAHGQAMTSTATAAANARVVSSPAPSQKPSVATAMRDHDRDEDARDAVGQALHRRLAGLRVGDQARDLRQRGVGADSRRADDEAAADVDRRARDLVARRLLDRHGLAGQQRLVDRARALDHDAVGGDLLARPDDEAVADGEAARRARAARGRRRRARPRPWRPARAAPPARRPRGAWRAPRSSGRPAGTS